MNARWMLRPLAEVDPETSGATNKEVRRSAATRDSTPPHRVVCQHRDWRLWCVFGMVLVFAVACSRSPQAPLPAHEPTGRLLDNDGKPFSPPLRVTAKIDGSSQSREVVTDSEGRFVLRDLGQWHQLWLEFFSGTESLYVRPMARRNSIHRQLVIIMTPSAQPFDLGTWIAEDYETRKRRIDQRFGPYCEAGFKGGTVQVPDDFVVPFLLQREEGHWDDSWSLQQPKRPDLAALCLRQTTTDVGEYWGSRDSPAGFGGSAENYHWDVVAILRSGRPLRRSFYEAAPRTASGSKIGDVTIAETGQTKRLNDKVNKWLDEDTRAARPPGSQ